MQGNNGQSKEQFFKGKVVIVYLINPPEAFTGGIAVYNPQVEEWFGRIFLMGEVPPSPDDWTSGLRTGIAFDQIAHFLEFSDENEYLEKSSSAMDGKPFKSYQ